MTFSATPPSYTLLHGQIIPEYGGDTLWASATAAYEALSAPFKTLLEGLSAEHDFRHGFRESLAEPGGRGTARAGHRRQPAGASSGDPHPSGNGPQGDLRQLAVHHSNSGYDRRRKPRDSGLLVRPIRPPMSSLCA